MMMTVVRGEELSASGGERRRKRPRQQHAIRSSTGSTHSCAPLNPFYQPAFRQFDAHESRRRAAEQFRCGIEQLTSSFPPLSLSLPISPLLSAWSSWRASTHLSSPSHLFQSLFPFWSSEKCVIKRNLHHLLIIAVIIIVIISVFSFPLLLLSHSSHPFLIHPQDFSHFHPRYFSHLLLTSGGRKEASLRRVTGVSSSATCRVLWLRLWTLLWIVLIEEESSYIPL